MVRRAHSLWWLGALLTSNSTDVNAAWRCVAPFDNVFVVDHAVEDIGEIRCNEIGGIEAVEAIDEPMRPVPPLQAVAATRSTMVDTTTFTTFTTFTTVSHPATRGSGLVLAPRELGPVLARASASARRTDFDGLIDRAASDYGQDADLLRAIVQVESHFNPNAVSAKGAIGLMQIMPTTAARLGLAEPGRALFRPESNLRIGALYVQRLSAQFAGALDLVIAAYNAGEGAVVRYGNAVPPYAETQDYVRAVLAAYRQMTVVRP